VEIFEISETTNNATDLRHKYFELILHYAANYIVVDLLITNTGTACSIGADPLERLIFWFFLKSKEEKLRLGHSFVWR